MELWNIRHGARQKNEKKKKGKKKRKGCVVNIEPIAEMYSSSQVASI